MNSWGGWIDPDQLYFNHFHKPIGKDFRRWNNDKISEMLNSARNSVNRSERTKIYLEIQNFLAEEVPWYPLYSAILSEHIDKKFLTSVFIHRDIIAT